MNNYCTHGKLAVQWGMRPKGLYQMLIHMYQATLIKSKKRPQKKINVHIEFLPSHTVTTEFRYFPLRNIIDVIAYCVHKLSHGVKQKQVTEQERRKWVCRYFQTEYQLFNILQWANSNGAFIFWES